MKVQVHKVIGNNKLVIDIDEREDKVALAKAAVFSEPDICFLCKGTEIYLVSNKADVDGKAFMYIKRKCANPKCNATSTLGENTGGMGYFWKKWEIYTRPESTVSPETIMGDTANKQMPTTHQTVALEDLPF